MARCEHLVLLCGHYEGIDERVLQDHVDEEISIGDYVLTNGCLAAIVLLDSLARFIPEVLGNRETVHLDSFENGILDSPQYTKPLDFRGKKVPDVLLGGHHGEIEKWRHSLALEKTKRVRPDLFLAYLNQLDSGTSLKKNKSCQLSIDLPVRNLKRSLKFYQSILGFSVLVENEFEAVLSFENVKIFIHNQSDIKQGPCTFYINYENARQFTFLLKNLRRHVNLKENSLNKKGQSTFSVNDLDGNRWLISCDLKN